MYAAWDGTLFHSLMHRFGLPTASKPTDFTKAEAVLLRIAFELAIRPDLLIMDDAFSVLDNEMQESVKEMIQQIGVKTVVLTTRDIEQIGTYGDSADLFILLEKGAAILSDPADAIRETHHRARVSFPGPIESLRLLADVESHADHTPNYSVVFSGDPGEFETKLGKAGGRIRGDISPVRFRDIVKLHLKNTRDRANKPNLPCSDWQHIA